MLKNYFLGWAKSPSEFKIFIDKKELLHENDLYSKKECYMRKLIIYWYIEKKTYYIVIKLRLSMSLGCKYLNNLIINKSFCFILHTSNFIFSSSKVWCLDKYRIANIAYKPHTFENGDWWGYMQCSVYVISSPYGTWLIGEYVYHWMDF